MKYCLSNDTWGEDEYKAVNQVLNSRRFTIGPSVARMEKGFAEYFGAKYAVMSSSGSSANLLAIASMLYSGRLSKGDEVLVPAVSWSTTYFPIEQMGLKIRLVDIDRNTLNIDINKAKKAVTDKTKAVFAVNLLGNPNDFEALMGLCKEYDLVLLEDNCESMGAEIGGKKAGTFGLMGTFSSYFSHHICTMEGGYTVTNNEELYHYMLSIRSHGWTRNLPEGSPIYTKAEDPFYESFRFIVPGFNVRPLEIEAAAGIEQLRKLDDFVQQRRKNAEYFNKLMADDSRFYIQKETGKSSWFGFAIILNESLAGQRDRYVSALRAADIEVRPIVAGNFARQPVFKYIDASIYGGLENADYIHDNGFFVGNHSVEMSEQLDYLKKVLDSVK
jgi:CDP-6-deoxy-D-xylo-4-hexulose-3-dehydrase